MRPTESMLERLTDYQIRGLAGLLGFTGALRGLVKAELPAAFLAALEKDHDGVIPAHIWKIGSTRTDKDSMMAMRQRVALATRERGDEPPTKKSAGRSGKTSRGTEIPPDSTDGNAQGRRRSARLARKTVQMELDASDSDEDLDKDEDEQGPTVETEKRRDEGDDTMGCFQSLVTDLKSVQAVLDEVRKLATSRRTKDLALIGLQDEIEAASATLRKLRTGLEVGQVRHTVKELKKEAKTKRSDPTKAFSYAEAARRGAQAPPVAVRKTPAWSATRTFFLKPEDDTMRTKEIPAWMFGAKLRQKFGAIPEGGDPPLLRLHRTARGEWQMLVAAWARDKLTAADQNRVDFQEFGFWILERREVLSGPSAVISRVPLELSDDEIKQGLLEGSRSLLEAPVIDIMKAVRIQRLKRREVSAEDPTKSSWVPGKSVRIIFPADELRQKFLGLGGIYLYWQYVPIREYVPPTYYCSVCKKRGGHSTQFHRVQARAGPSS